MKISYILLIIILRDIKIAADRVQIYIINSYQLSRGTRAFMQFEIPKNNIFLFKNK